MEPQLSKTKQYSSKVKEHTVRLVRDARKDASSRGRRKSQPPLTINDKYPHAKVQEIHRDSRIDP